MSIPLQRITLEEKLAEYSTIKDWARACISSFDSLYFYNQGMASSLYRMMLLNYQLYNGSISASEYDVLEQPYDNKNEEGLSSLKERIIHYDITTPRVDFLFGETTKRPFNYTVVCEDYDTITAATEKKGELVNGFLEQKLRKALESRGAIPKQEGAEEQEQEMPKSYKEIEYFMTYEWKHQKEISLNALLGQLLKSLNIKFYLDEMYKDLLIAGQEISYTNVLNNEPVFRRVDPRFFAYNRGTETTFIHDSDWAKEWRYITLSQILDEYGDVLEEDEIDTLNSYVSSGNLGFTNGIMSGGFGDITSFLGADIHPPFQGTGTFMRILVINYEWKSLKKIGFVTKIDELGNETEEIVDENYKEAKGEKVEWRWINEVWEATRVGIGIIINARPKPYQHRKEGNLSYCRLSYTGFTMQYPLVSKIRTIQLLYNVIIHRLKLLVERAKGRGLVVDVAQIPVALLGGGKAEDALFKMLYFFDVSGILFINSKEEGEDGKRSTFNQFQNFDVGISDSAAFYINLMVKLEQMVEAVSGISRERLGNVTNTETLGGIERSVSQSSHTTEIYNNIHNQVVMYALTNLLEEATVAFSGSKRKGQYLLNDGARHLFEIDLDEQLLNAEFGVFVSNSSKDKELLDVIKGLMPQAMQSGQVQLGDLVKVMTTDSPAKANHILEDSIKRSQQQQQEQLKKDQEFQQQMKQMEMQVAQDTQKWETQLKKMDLDSKERIAQANNETRLAIANLQGLSNIEVAKIYDDTEKTSILNDDSSDRENRKLDIEQQRADIEEKRLVLDKKNDSTKNSYNVVKF